MMRYLEYVYLLAAVGIAVFMAISFKDLPTTSRITLSFGAMICAFMYSFRRKQRQMLEEMDRRAPEDAPDDVPSDNEDGD